MLIFYEQCLNNSEQLRQVLGSDNQLLNQLTKVKNSIKYIRIVNRDDQQNFYRIIYLSLLSNDVEVIDQFINYLEKIVKKPKENDQFFKNCLSVGANNFDQSLQLISSYKSIQELLRIYKQFLQINQQWLKQIQKMSILAQLINFHEDAICKEIDTILIGLLKTQIINKIVEEKCNLGYFYQGNEISVVQKKQFPTSALMKLVSEIYHISIIINDFDSKPNKDHKNPVFRPETTNESKFVINILKLQTDYHFIDDSEAEICSLGQNIDKMKESLWTSLGIESCPKPKSSSPQNQTELEEKTQIYYQKGASKQNENQCQKNSQIQHNQDIVKTQEDKILKQQNTIEKLNETISQYEIQLQEITMKLKERINENTNLQKKVQQLEQQQISQRENQQQPELACQNQYNNQNMQPNNQQFTNQNQPQNQAQVPMQNQFQNQAQFPIQNQFQNQVQSFGNNQVQKYNPIQQQDLSKNYIKPQTQNNYNTNQYSNTFSNNIAQYPTYQQLHQNYEQKPQNYPDLSNNYFLDNNSNSNNNNYNYQQRPYQNN